MSNFDPEAFMNETVDQPMETERTLCPVGEYPMMIDDFDSKAFQAIPFKDKQTGEDREFHKFGCPCVVQDPAVAQKLGIARVVVFKNCNLDFGDDGKLAWGPNKNTDLGQLRHAVGQNDRGKTWSPGNLRGAGPFMGKVEHRSGKRKDGSEFVIAEVTRVAPIR